MDVVDRLKFPLALASSVFPLLAVGTISAQQPGDTVRVSGEQVGIVVEADSGGLLLSFGYAPYAGMQSLEAWGGTGNHTARGFKYGFMAGAISAGAFTALLCAAYCSSASDYAGIPVTSVAVGLVAGAVGSIIGSAFETDIWRPVPIPGGLSLRWYHGRNPSSGTHGRTAVPPQLLRAASRSWPCSP